MNLSDSKKKLALAGVVCGIVAAVLAAMGNPANMAICICMFCQRYGGSAQAPQCLGGAVRKTGDRRHS